MSWEYRVVEVMNEDGEDEFVIREVYNIHEETLWSQNTQAAFGGSEGELRQDLLMMLRAFDKPIMEETTEPVSGFPVLKEVTH